MEPPHPMLRSTHQVFNRFPVHSISIGLLGGSLSLALLTGCGSDSPPPTPPAAPEASTPQPSSSPSSSPPSTTPASPAAPSAAQNTTIAPLPTTADISVEGEPTTIALEAYQPEGIPIELAFPQESFKPDTTQGLRWTELRFLAGGGGYVTEEAYVAVVWPRETATLNEALQMVVGDRGWVQQQGIDLIDSTAQPVSPQTTVYPWQRQRWRFEKDGGTPGMIVGEVILGELNGQGFWVVTHMPVEFGDGYAPRIPILLKTLRSRSL